MLNLKRLASNASRYWKSRHHSNSNRVSVGTAKQRMRHELGRNSFEQLETRNLLASVIMQSVTADGATQLSLTYDVREPVAVVNIGLYRSSDASFGGDTLLGSVALSDDADRTLGIHVKTLTIGSILFHHP